MARLPQPGGDSGNWGTVLNDYLAQAHAADGSLKPGVVGPTQLQANAVNIASVTDGAIIESKLSSAVQTKLNTVGTVADGSITTAKVADGNVTKAKLSTTVQASLDKADAAPTVLSGLSDVTMSGLANNQVLTYDSSVSKWKPVTPSAPAHKVKWESVKDHGAVGNGSTDDTAAVAAAVTAAHAAGAAIYFPEGSYLVTSFPALNSYDVVVGDGSDLSTIIYQGSSTLISLTNRQRVSFKSLNFWITGASGKGFELANCFRCSFESVVVRGSHTGANYPAYQASVGVTLSNNTGGISFNNCDINNFGTGLVTSCIQNYITNSKFSTNYVGVLGTGNNANAGLSISNSEFVSDTGANTTSRHIFIDGSANDWWLTNVWFEGAASAVVVGVSGTGGPSQFGMVNCKVAARTFGVDLQHCRQPYLANVIFDADPGGSPTELRINSSTCAEGTAIGLITTVGSTIADSVFPQYWTVIGRGSSMMTSLTRTLTLRDPSGGTSDLLMAQNSSYSDIASILSSGAYLSNQATAGIILKSPNGHYWRMTVNDSGVTSAADLGTGRPFS